MLLAVALSFMVGTVISVAALRRRTDCRVCANLGHSALYVTAPEDKTPTYHGDIGTCGCTGEEWLTGALSSSADQTIITAVEAVGFEATLKVLEGIASKSLDF